MKTFQIDIREQQKASWNKFSPGWKKWDDFTMSFLQQQGDQIIKALELQADDSVLDIATGTGEPGLSIATIVHKGKVTATDLSEGMLQIAKEKADTNAIKNFYPVQAGVTKLPFSDNSFDAISCRLGFMFFPDMLAAAKEIFRVVKPGGKVALTVWAEPQYNFWITVLMGAINRHISLPEKPKGSPGMFRCAESLFMSSLLEKVGFEQTQETLIDGIMTCRSTDEYWNFMNDVVPPVVAVFQQADEAVKATIKKEVYDALEARFPTKRKDIGYGARLIQATKPL